MALLFWCDIDFFTSQKHIPQSFLKFERFFLYYIALPTLRLPLIFIPYTMLRKIALGLAIEATDGASVFSKYKQFSSKSLKSIHLLLTPALIPPLFKSININLFYQKYRQHWWTTPSFLPDCFGRKNFVKASY